MASKIRMQFLDKGFKGLLNDEGTKEMLRSEARSLLSGLPPGFEMTEMQGRFGGGRPVIFVGTGTDEARQAQAETNVLMQRLVGGE